MVHDIMAEKATKHLNMLCGIKGGRRVGSRGNREATGYVAKAMESMGYIVDTTPFPCMDHESGRSSLSCEGLSYEVHISPLSNGCDVKAELVVASTVDELERCDCSGKLLLINDGLCAEPLMPKNFPFYNPGHHQKIYSLIESKQPRAVITATGRNPQMAAALYPYPVFEDGDFNIPSVFCTDVTGERIAAKAGSVFSLMIEAKRIPSTGCNVIAAKNPAAWQKVVVCAHIDAKENTPGALDNAAGVTVGLLLAEMLIDYNGPMGVEIIAFNGEDYYSAAGQLDYLARYGNRLSNVVLGINVDGAGYVNGRTGYSFYGLKKAMEKQVRKAFEGEGFVEGFQWYQGDHMIFIQGGVPAVALTSENAMELLNDIIHTPKDEPENINPERLIQAAEAIYGLISGMRVRNKTASKQAFSR